MAIANTYVKLRVPPSSDCVSVESVILSRYIEEEYEYHRELARQRSKGDIESLKSFKMRYILLQVAYNGRTRVDEKDVMRSLEQQSMATKASENESGVFYRPTGKLRTLLEKQERDHLIENGKD